LKHISKGVRVHKTALAAFAILGLGLIAPIVPVAEAAKPDGKLAYNLNVIGRPNDYKGGGADNGSRHAIFIPLVTDFYTDPCATQNGANNPDTTLAPTKGVMLNLVAGTSFSVTDGDATDKEATLQVIPPSSGSFNVYAEARGKPGGCLDLESYVTNGTTLTFLGSVDVDRGNGKPVQVNLTNLIYPSGVDLFADPYSGLFWQLYNNGLRLMNVRFYEA
jgi:hypothetical protein